MTSDDFWDAAFLAVLPALVARDDSTSQVAAAAAATLATYACDERDGKTEPGHTREAEEEAIREDMRYQLGKRIGWKDSEWLDLLQICERHTELAMEREPVEVVARAAIAWVHVPRGEAGKEAAERAFSALTDAVDALPPALRARLAFEATR